MTRSHIWDILTQAETSSDACKPFIYKQFVACDVCLKTDICTLKMPMPVCRPTYIVHGLRATFKRILTPR